MIYIIGGLYLIACLFLYLSQEKFIFFPAKLSPNYPFSQFKNFEEVFFPVDENVTIHALHFKAEKKKGIILYFHGNARALESWGFAAEEFVNLGYDVMMPDYRSYGKSTGSINEADFYKDAMHIYQYLLKNHEEKEIIIYGRSLGTGIACELASKTNPKSLILVTPYLSLVAVSKNAMPYLPISLLARYRFENDKRIQLVKSPIHIFHGTNDELIPYKQAVRLSQLSEQENILTTIEDSGHNNITEFPAYKDKMLDLLSN